MIRRIGIALLLTVTFLALGAEIDGRDDLSLNHHSEMEE